MLQFVIWISYETLFPNTNGERKIRKYTKSDSATLCYYTLKVCCSMFVNVIIANAILYILFGKESAIFHQICDVTSSSRNDLSVFGYLDPDLYSLPDVLL